MVSSTEIVGAAKASTIGGGYQLTVGGLKTKVWRRKRRNCLDFGTVAMRTARRGVYPSRFIRSIRLISASLGWASAKVPIGSAPAGS